MISPFIDLTVYAEIYKSGENPVFKTKKNRKRQNRLQQSRNLDPGFLPKTHIYF